MILQLLKHTLQHHREAFRWIMCPGPPCRSNEFLGGRGELPQIVNVVPTPVDGGEYPAIPEQSRELSVLGSYSLRPCSGYNEYYIARISLSP